MRALNLLRGAEHYQRDAFSEGLRDAGYTLVGAIPDPRPGDALLTWNRKSKVTQRALDMEKGGGAVLVAENAYLPPDLIGPGWYSLAKDHHLGAGRWFNGGPQRWDRLRVDLRPWRTGGTEVIILGQTGGGERPWIAAPKEWAEATQARLGGRVRPHPWRHPDNPPLVEDIANARCVLTWNSSAALIALMLGIPVFYEGPKWIGAEASRPIMEFGQEPKRDDAARLSMFRRLAWAIWHIDEIRAGIPFRALREC